MPVMLGHAPNSIASNLYCTLQLDKLLHPVLIVQIFVLTWLVERLSLILGRSILRSTICLLSGVTSMNHYSVHYLSKTGVMTIDYQVHIATHDGGNGVMVIRPQAVAAATPAHRIFVAHHPDLIILTPI